MSSTLPLQSPSSPPAVYSAFLRANRWKNGFMAAQFGVIGFLLLCVFAIGRREPDVVLVDSTSGESHYLNRSVAGETLVRFLEEHRQRPSDLTVHHFTQHFVTLALAINATTVDEAWPEALSLMALPLREQQLQIAQKAHLMETEKAAQTRSNLELLDVSVVEQTPELFHLQVRVTRHRTSLLTQDVEQIEPLVVDLVERVVPRSLKRPDGLEVAAWAVQSAPPPSTSPHPN